MHIVRSTTVSTRLLLVVALAVVALLLAPVAGAADDVTTAPAAPAGTTGVPAEVGAGAVTHVGAVSAQRRVKKARKARKRSATVAAPATSPRWTGRTLTYHDGLPARWTWSLRTAVAQWNAAGLGITLTPVSDPAAAQVRISYGDIGGSSGLATVGSVTDAFVKLSDRYRSAVADEYDRVEVAGVLAHELGHVLGLGHVTTGCALMGPVMDIVGCGVYDLQQPDTYRCDLIGAAAVAQAIRLYPGTARPLGTGRCGVGA